MTNILNIIYTYSFRSMAFIKSFDSIHKFRSFTNFTKMFIHNFILNLDDLDE